MPRERHSNSKHSSLPVVLEQLELFTPEGKPAVQNTVAVERNYLRFPAFSLSTHGNEDDIYLEDEIETVEGKVKISWRVTRDVKQKIPGKFARKLHRTIERLISNLSRPILNPIRLGSMRDICKFLGISYVGPNVQLIKEALTNLVTTSYRASGCFYVKDENRYLKVGEGDDIFHLYSRIIYRGQKLPNGYTADAVYICFDDLYLRNLNANYTVPIDWNLWERLKGDIAQRMYEILSLDVFVAFERKVRELQIQEPKSSLKEIMERLPHHLGRISFEKRYKTYCQYFPIVPQNTRWSARKQLASAHAQLARERYLHRDPNDDKESWDAPSGEPQNWRIRYYVGKRSLDEYWNAKRRFLEEPKSQPRPARALPPAPREKSKQLPSPSSPSLPVLGQAEAPERPLSAEHQAFIAFLREQGVKRAEQLVESSPHSIDMLEVIREDYLRRKRQADAGKFSFKEGGPSWLSWTVMSSDYVRPKGLVTHKEREERERLKAEREREIRQLAERLQSGEFRYFRHRQGEWVKIEVVYLDSANLSDWHIRYFVGTYDFTALLSQVSREYFASDLAEIDDDEEVPF